MHKIGIHVSNGPIDYADLERMISVGAKHYTLLHDQSPYMLRLVGSGAQTCLVRYYAKAVLDRNAYEYAQEVVTAAQQWSIWSRDLVFANEANLDYEGGQGWDNPRQVAEWMMTVADYIRRLDPTLKLHAPAFSPVGNWWQYFAELMRYQGHFDAVDLHCYGTFQGMSDIVRAAKSQTSKPLFISECNGPGTLDFFQWIESDPQVIGATYFTWFWANPDLPGWAGDLRGSVLEREMRDYISSGDGGSMDDPRIAQLLAQNALITEGFKQILQGKFTGADGLAGTVVALQGGAPLNFEITFPK